MCFLPVGLNSQHNKDSLWNAWENKNLHDTLRLEAIGLFITEGYLYTNPDSAIFYAKIQLAYAEAKKYDEDITSALNSLGIATYFSGDYNQAIKYFEQSYEIDKKLGNKTGVAKSLNNMGIIYRNQGNYRMALDCYMRSQKINESVSDSSGTANCLNNIGIIYIDQREFDQAIICFEQSLKIRKAIKDQKGIATSYNNLGWIKDEQGLEAKKTGNVILANQLFDEAMKYHQASLKIELESGFPSGITSSYTNIGKVYKDKGDLNKALEFYLKGLEAGKEKADKKLISQTLTNIGIIYLHLGELQKAKDYCEQGLSISKQLGTKIESRSATETLWRINKKLGDYKSALIMYEEFNTLNDSIQSDENKKDIIRQEYKYNYEKQATADSVKHAELQKVKDAQIEQQEAIAARQEAELQNKRNQQYALFGGLGLLFVFLAFVYNRFRVTRQQKKIIEQQKSEVEGQKKVVEKAHDLLEEKNKEILDSIHYAKRIQAAILPPARIVKEYLPESFILYKPKDIVAGDFYWVESPNTGESERAVILFAAADCTGHGVPGALVSVVCNNALNRAVREFGLTDPGHILDKTREIVVEEFQKSEDDVKDGMDISLVALTHVGTDSPLSLQWAGANNPLWIIRNGEVLEFKPDKQPIGKYSDTRPFTTHNVALQKEDAIYIFTDGFQDQFGGEKGKKYKAANLKQLLLTIQHETMDRQRKLIEEAFNNWKTGYEQVDDVCVIGVRI